MTETERVDRFEAAYNRIDHELTDLTSSGGDRRKHGFAAKVRIAANRRKRLAKFSDFLLEIGELRNALVHGRLGDETYLAVPSEATVLELERIEKSAFSPERVLPRFERKVVKLQAGQPLADAWRLVREDGFSRYPVYEQNRFVGLLTSNGFARWCARQLKGTKIDVDTADARVGDVVAFDHRREAVEFVSREALIDDVEQMFRETRPLEAVLITEHGRPDQSPIGMICAQDMASLPR